MLDIKFFRKISADVVMKYRKHIFDPDTGSNAKQVDGKPYPEYKRRNGISKYKQRKATGNMVVNGVPQNARYAGSKAPVLTGSLLRDYGFQKYLSNGLSFGFKSEGAKVKRLAELGRVLSSNETPIPKSVVTFIEKEASKHIKKELGKNKGGTINIKVT